MVAFCFADFILKIILLSNLREKMIPAANQSLDSPSPSFFTTSTYQFKESNFSFWETNTTKDMEFFRRKVFSLTRDVFLSEEKIRFYRDRLMDESLSAEKRFEIYHSFGQELEKYRYPELPFQQFVEKIFLLDQRIKENKQTFSKEKIITLENKLLDLLLQETENTIVNVWVARIIRGKLQQMQSYSSSQKSKVLSLKNKQVQPLDSFHWTREAIEYPPSERMALLSFAISGTLFAIFMIWYTCYWLQNRHFFIPRG